MRGFQEIIDQLEPLGARVAGVSADTFAALGAFAQQRDAIFQGLKKQLEAGGLEEAQASELLPASLEGDDLTIAFNPAYLLDGLGAIEEAAGNLASLRLRCALGCIESLSRQCQV